MGGTGQVAGMLRGQVFGPGAIPLPSNWIDGRRTRAAAKAPQRKRPCRSRATARRSLLRHACEQRESMRCESQIENYRAKAKKFARLAAVAKSPRHSRQCRKLAEMYWALALGEELSTLHLQNRMSKGARHGHLSRRVSQTFRAEMEKSY